MDSINHLDNIITSASDAAFLARMRKWCREQRIFTTIDNGVLDILDARFVLDE